MICVCNVCDVDLPLDTASTSSHLFSSGVGVSVLTTSVQQTSVTRLSVCRDLLVFVIMTQRLSEQVTCQRPAMSVLHDNENNNPNNLYCRHSPRPQMHF